MSFTEKEELEELKNADISSINISLDTLNDQKFKTITQRNHFAKVWENIQRCMQENIHVKLNIVVIKGVNDDEIIDFVNLTKGSPPVNRILLTPNCTKIFEMSKISSGDIKSFCFRKLIFSSGIQ